MILNDKGKSWTLDSFGCGHCGEKLSCASDCCKVRRNVTDCGRKTPPEGQQELWSAVVTNLVDSPTVPLYVFHWKTEHFVPYVGYKDNAYHASDGNVKYPQH